jgi:hypothetical protein
MYVQMNPQQAVFGMRERERNSTNSDSMAHSRCRLSERLTATGSGLNLVDNSVRTRVCWCVVIGTLFCALHARHIRVCLMRNAECKECA